MFCDWLKVTTLCEFKFASSIILATSDDRLVLLEFFSILGDVRLDAGDRRADGLLGVYLRSVN
jgi:hypothetical protein